MSDDAPRLIVTCACGQRMKASPESAGKLIKCVRCGEPVKVEASAHAPVPTGDHDPCWSRVAKVIEESGLVDESQVQKAKAKAQSEGKGVFQTLIDDGHLDKSAFHQLVSRQFGIASIDLSNYHVAKDLLALVPPDLARARMVVPIDKLGRLLTVGMACPVDSLTLEEISSTTGLRVKPMLCKYDDIVEALNKYYPGQQEIKETSGLSWEKLGLMTKAAPKPGPKPAPTAPAPVESVAKAGEVAESIRTLSALPIEPGTLDALDKLDAGDVNVTRDALACVQRDPALALLLIGYANLPVFGAAGQIASLTPAAALLGAEGIKAVAQSVRGQKSPNGTWDWNRFQQRSVFAACAAAEVAQINGAVDPDEAFSAGLLHEIGRLALALVLRDKMKAAPDSADHSQLAASEQQAFNVTHGEAGEALCKRWGLPENIRNCVRFHGDPAAAPADALVPVVALAAALAESFLETGPRRRDRMDQCGELLAAANAESTGVVQLFSRASAAYDRLCAM